LRFVALGGAGDGVMEHLSRLPHIGCCVGSRCSGVDVGLALRIEVITLQNAVFYGALTTPPNRFCAKLSGTTTPSGLVLSPDNSDCLFDKLASDTSTLPVHQLTDFRKCP
jgi:hypothetical protein